MQNKNENADYVITTDDNILLDKLEKLVKQDK